MVDGVLWCSTVSVVRWLVAVESFGDGFGDDVVAGSAGQCVDHSRSLCHLGGRVSTLWPWPSWHRGGMRVIQAYRFALDLTPAQERAVLAHAG
ncbi:hypothetical protein ACTMS0_15710, partial [Micromonospora sp. H33]|uniref:hypothetical protein n=1 Tax=Micromonospora sp. H33 TaxID=3452215 RepID=UPI003F8C3C47